MQLPLVRPRSSTRRSADIWTVRLLSSTMVPGQTAAMISFLETTSPTARSALREYRARASRSPPAQRRRYYRAETDRRRAGRGGSPRTEKYPTERAPAYPSPAAVSEARARRVPPVAQGLYGADYGAIPKISENFIADSLLLAGDSRCFSPSTNGFKEEMT